MHWLTVLLHDWLREYQDDAEVVDGQKLVGDVEKCSDGRSMCTGYVVEVEGWKRKAGQFIIVGAGSLWAFIVVAFCVRRDAATCSCLLA